VSLHGPRHVLGLGRRVDGARGDLVVARQRRLLRKVGAQTGGVAGRGAAQHLIAHVVEPGLRAHRAAFDSLVDGIRRADAESVAKLYWNSPQLTVFNNNGTVTRTWEQVRSNRASSYPDAKNVQLDVRDVRVQMTGRDGAIVTCLWTQSQEFRGTPESATGRLTVVFRLINNGWKIIHTHTSPAAPDPSRLLPSERNAVDDATTKPPAQTRP